MSSPQWVMYGAREGDRYVIYASSTLSRATLESRVSVRRGQIPTLENPLPFVTTLTAQMDDLVVVEGPSYLDALQKLLASGAFTATGQPAIE